MRDNVMIERLWRSVKYKQAYLKAYDSVAHAKADITEYVQCYNFKRKYSSLDKQTFGVGILSIDLLEPKNFH